MKIIGKTDDGFILEASENEVTNLVGYYSRYDDELRKSGMQLKVGAEIQVGKMYKQLYHLKGMEGELARIATTLRGFADHLEVIRPVLQAKETT